MDKEKTGKLIKEARIKMGYTQTELGDLLGVSNKAVSRWENGDSFPDVGILENLSTCLNIRIEDLINGEHSTNESRILIELTRIVRLQSRDTIRRRKKLFEIVFFSLVLCARFYFGFISSLGIQWSSKNDFLIWVIWYFILINNEDSKWKILSTGDELNSKVAFTLTVLSSAGSIIFIYGGFYIIQDILLRFIDAANIGPMFSYFLGGIVLLNIFLFEYTWQENRNNHIVTITPIINISTILICCSFREWMVNLSASTYELKILEIIIVNIFFFIIAAYCRKKRFINVI